MSARALILGAGGMLGQALVATAPREIEVHGRDRAALDITDRAALAAVMDELRPEVVINAAAWTDVDGAEDRPDAAFAVNGAAVAGVARACRERGAQLVQISTDYVFGGDQPRPRAPEDEARPINVYGASKRDGELCAMACLGGEALILRTGWLYDVRGSNFLLTMLERLAGDEPVKVVSDQLGTPTWVPELAGAIWSLVQRGIVGVHHWTHAGSASWYDFAVAIQEEALARGLLGGRVPVRPIRSRDLTTRAARPACSLLDKTHTWRALGGPAPHWREGLRAALDRLAAERG